MKQKSKINKYRINENIRAYKVIVINEEGKNIGEMLTTDAIKMAQELDLDLVEINPNNKPPICKIVDYGKMLYNLKKKQKNIKQTETKIIKIRYNTDENDLKIKGKKIKEFLKDKNNVKIIIQLKGRENQYKNIAKEKIIQYANEFSDISQPNPKIQESKNSISIELKPK